jgi:membrane-associated phospholipid phosphatase
MWNQKKVICVALLSLAIFSLITIFRNNFVDLDVSVNAWATSVQTRNITVIAVIISDLFETLSLLILTLLTALYLFNKSQKENSILLIGVMLGETAITETAKVLTHSVRPTNGLISATGYAFPSGHSSGIVVFFGLLLYIVWPYLRSSSTKTLLCALSIAVILIVGFDRIYLNVHWLSDVLGGYLLGIFWLSFSISTFQYLKKIGY